MHRSTTNGPNKSQVPKSQRETNLNMLTHASDPDKAPKIHKRSFSDESHVSSVSSFSSVSDFMHIARLQAMSPPAEKLRFINFNHGNNQNQLKIQPKSNDVKPNDSTEKLENPKNQKPKIPGCCLFHLKTFEMFLLQVLPHSNLWGLAVVGIPCKSPLTLLLGLDLTKKLSLRKV